jgi:hypothetical protein
MTDWYLSFRGRIAKAIYLITHGIPRKLIKSPKKKSKKRDDGELNIDEM